MEATKQMAKSKAPFRYSPQLVVLRSSRNPVTMVSQVRAKIQACKPRKGTTNTQIMVKKVLSTRCYHLPLLKHLPLLQRGSMELQFPLSLSFDDSRINSANEGQFAQYLEARWEGVALNLPENHPLLLSWKQISYKRTFLTLASWLSNHFKDRVRF